MKLVLRVVTLFAVIGLAPATIVLASTADSSPEEIAQIKQQPAQIREQFYDLIIKGKFAISDLQAAVKSVVYHQDFQQFVIKVDGIDTYEDNMRNSRAAVKKRRAQVQHLQQSILKFFTQNPEFINSLSPEVREQAVSIVKLNISSQIKVWEQEQRQLDREWKCSGSSTTPQCL